MTIFEALCAALDKHAMAGQPVVAWRFTVEHLNRLSLELSGRPYKHEGGAVEVCGRPVTIIEHGPPLAVTRAKAAGVFGVGSATLIEGFPGAR